LIVRDSLKAGQSTTRRFDVDRSRTIGFMGDEGRVYSTPAMIMDIEITARDLIKQHLDDGEDTVGTHVSVDHLAATIEGDTAEVTVTITEVEGRAVTVEARVKDSLEDVGRGIHKRFIVNTAKTFERIKAKKEKLG